ncbi:flagellar protein FlaG [Marinospirillum perlucidum]|uniref:flagellar protein FlaG n=1 Tax=Marinospirillum perlucidum TaxID=1982602 RepID=UPI00139040E2|nr:flagellar protein FlaG [Marinospirillum perlucidum]
MASEVLINSVPATATISDHLLPDNLSAKNVSSLASHDSAEKPLLANSALHSKLPVSEEKQKSEDELSPEELSQLIDEINLAFYLQNRSLKFQIHNETEDFVVKVINTKTDEVIRQYPSEEILALRSRLIEGDTESFSTQVY